MLIRKSGGFVMKDRVSGQLAVTRALGDLALKKEVNLRFLFSFLFSTSRA